jgi:hypothetical protein
MALSFNNSSYINAYIYARVSILELSIQAIIGTTAIFVTSGQSMV